MTLFYLALGAVFAAFLQRYIAVRVWGFPVFSRGFTGDASAHFAIVRHLKRNPRSRFIENYLISPEPMSYPILFHRLSTLFPLSLLARKQWLPNMVLHLLGTLFFVLVSWHITDASLLVTSLALAVYLAMPINWIFHGPEIAYLGLTSRLLARLTSSATYLCLSLGVILDEMWLLGLGAGAAVPALLSAQFARQALFFCLPILSIILLDIRPFIILLFAMLVALMLGRRYFYDSVCATVRRWRLYRTKTKQSTYVRRTMLGYFRWTVARDGHFGGRSSPTYC